MYAKHKIIFLLFFVCSLIGQIYFEVKIDSSVLSFLAVYYSISFACCTFGVSTLFGSKLSVYLYDTVDPKIKTQRILQTVKEYYKFIVCINSVAMATILIVYLGARSKFFTELFKEKVVVLDINYFAVSLFFISLYATYLVIVIILEGMEKEAKLENSK